MIKIGWVGLGKMGIPMVTNLIRKGLSVCVYNRTKEKERNLLKLGATAATSLQQLSQDCDIVFTIVSDDAAVEEVYNGENGLLSHPKPGVLLVDMSTVGVQTSKKLASDCSRKNVRFFEAKVSGSVKPAEEGQLLILAGGEMQDYQKIQPLFSILGKQSIYMGEVGKASAAKICLNYFLALTFQGLAETVLFAQHLNMEKADILNLINESACGSGVTKMKSQPIINNDFSPAFALKHITKDLRLAHNEGLASPLFFPLQATFQAALQTGLGERDAISIIETLRMK
ncbi:NAD(P)-dependent oxidoreductase [Chitinophagaceae bacterium 26-R-25]|nr:NAD(P)-dependent oxidoreductase [Chitinophagaceae bacterium 26-R-25]